MHKKIANKAITPTSKHIPTVEECNACPHARDCHSGEFCITSRISRERKAQEKAAQRERMMSTGYRVVNKEAGMKAAVRLTDPARSIIITGYNSSVIEDVVFDARKEAAALARRLNKEPAYQEYGGKWTISEVHAR